MIVPNQTYKKDYTYTLLFKQDKMSIIDSIKGDRANVLWYNSHDKFVYVCCITTGIPIKIIPFNTILKDINET